MSHSFFFVNFQGFTKEFIVLKQDYIGVNYTGFYISFIDPMD